MVMALDCCSVTIHLKDLKAVLHYRSSSSKIWYDILVAKIPKYKNINRIFFLQTKYFDKNDHKEKKIAKKIKFLTFKIYNIRNKSVT